MRANGAVRRISVGEEWLAGKLEFAVLSVLAHYNGSYEDTLPDWYSALRLGLPELSHPRQLRDVFKSLCAAGLIELNHASAGPYPGRDKNRFFLLGPFRVVLTREGRVHWNTLRGQAIQI